MSPVRMMLSREVRRVPLDWEHPRDARDHLKPLFDETFDDAMERWVEGWQAWRRGERPDYATAELAEHTFVEWEGPPPNPDYYRPAWPEGTEFGIQMYETVSEGTPMSRVYPDSSVGRQLMAEELAGTTRQSLDDSLTVDDWLRVIAGEALAKDVHTGEVG